MRNRIRDASRSRSKGYHREISSVEAHGNKETNKLTKKWRLSDKRAESDRFVGTKMPRHLFSGKTDKGSRDRRWFLYIFSYSPLFKKINLYINIY